MTGLIIVFILHNLLALFLYSRSRQCRYLAIKRQNYSLLLFIFLALSLLGLQTGDYFSYINLVKEASGVLSSNPDYEGYITHMEPIYNYLAYIVGGNYMLWRLIVFGSSFIIVFYFAKKLGYNFYYFLFYFTILCLSGFLVGRMYWGLALFFGAIALFREEKKWWALLLCVCAAFAHKSLYILPALIPFAFLRFNKKFVFVSVIIFFLMSFLLTRLFGDLSVLSYFIVDLDKSIMTYTESEITGSVFGYSIGERIVYVSKFIAGCLIYFSLAYKVIIRKVEVPVFVHSFLILMTLSLLLAAALNSGHFGDGTIVYRYIEVIYYPAVFLFCYSVKNRLLSHVLKSSIVLLTLFSFESLMVLSMYYFTTI